jgi:hypothetical protein
MQKNAHNFCASFKLVPPPFWQKNNQQQEGDSRVKKVYSYLNKLIEWHCREDAQLICELKEHICSKWNNQRAKQFQMNVKETNHLQMQLNINTNQMVKLRQNIRRNTGLIIMASAEKLEQYQRQFQMNTAGIYTYSLEIQNKLVDKNFNMPVEPVRVYQCDPRECCDQLMNHTIQNGKLDIPQILGFNSLLLEIGGDKCGAGTSESLSLAITPHSHGKYGSIATCFYPAKAKDNYQNWREIALGSNRKDIIDQLFEFPNMICILKYAFQNNKLISKEISSLTMLFNRKSQLYWNEKQKQKLKSIPSPPALLLGGNMDR